MSRQLSLAWIFHRCQLEVSAQNSSEGVDEEANDATPAFLSVFSSNRSGRHSESHSQSSYTYYEMWAVGHSTQRLVQTPTRIRVSYALLVNLFVRSNIAWARYLADGQHKRVGLGEPQQDLKPSYHQPEECLAHPEQSERDSSQRHSPTRSTGLALFPRISWGKCCKPCFAMR